MMGKFLLFFLLIFGVCEALGHTTQNIKLAESSKDNSLLSSLLGDTSPKQSATLSSLRGQRPKQSICDFVESSDKIYLRVDCHDLTLSSLAMTPLFCSHCKHSQNVKQSIKTVESLKDSSDSIELNHKIDCHEVVPTSRNDDSVVDCHTNPLRIIRNDASAVYSHDSTTQNLAMTPNRQFFTKYQPIAITPTILSSLRGDTSPKQSNYDLRNGDDGTDSSETLLDYHNDDSRGDSSDKAFDYEFPHYSDESFLNSLITRFSLYNETYFMPVYYQTHIVQSPYNKPYKKLETKLQISAKMNIFRDLFWGIGAFFGYTQTSFFQIYSQHISSPFRSNDYSPEFMLYKPLNVEFWGGSLYNIRFGYRHKSNGEVNIQNGGNANFSRGIDTIALDIAYKISDFRLILKLWAYAKKSPKDIDKYLGYSDLILEYDFLSRNHLRLTIGNLAHNYAKYKGSIKLEYSFDIHNFALYLQYFYGYGDNMIEYNIKKHGVGIGFSVMRF